MVDNKNQKILNLILENSRLSCREIAKKAKMSVVTVINRIKELEKQKIIKEYTTKLDYEKLGYDVHVIINLKISKGQLFEMENKIASHPCVLAVYDIIGSFDSVVIARFKNRRSLDTFLKKIQTYDFVERTETKLILNTIKEENIQIS
tara:strand:+ start:66 stop:509 length:444 start_codon:yes stop_codon:yes gene_type:complete